MASSEAVIGPHGAGLTNIIFCPPQTKVIEIYSPNYVSVSYWNICNQIDLDYYYAFGIGERPPERKDPHCRNENIVVDIQQLKELIQKIGL